MAYAVFSCTKIPTYETGQLADGAKTKTLLAGKFEVIVTCYNAGNKEYCEACR